MYYTVFRHCLMHSGGRCTKRIKDKMDNVISNNCKALNDIEGRLLPELVDKYVEGFFVNLLNGTILDISEKYLDFFRNIVVSIMESVERAVHPEEFKLMDFDPYKL